MRWWLGHRRRWLARLVWPGAPSAQAFFGALAVVLVVLVSLPYVFGVHYWRSGDKYCEGHGLRCDLSIHVGGTVIVGLAGFMYFLRSELGAAKHWRRQAKREPESLFPWLPPRAGLTGVAAHSSSDRRRGPVARARRRLPGARGDPADGPLVPTIVSRDRLVEDIADDLDAGAGPQVIVGRTGSGKTMVLLKLADLLARRGQLPVPVSLRGTEKIDFAELARQAYLRNAHAANEEAADKQWRWIRRRRTLITVLADNLEKTSAEPAERVRALQLAAKQGLRLVVACRPEGIPTDFRQGRIDLDPLDRKEIVEQLCQRLATAQGRELPGEEREHVRSIVDRAEIPATPYYFALAEALAERDVLPSPNGSVDVRLALLRAYRAALTRRDVRPEAGLPSDMRERILKRLEAVAYARIEGARTEHDIDRRIAVLSPDDAAEISTHSVIDGAKRLGALERRYDDQVHFGHPTTLAYFASCFLRDHQDDRRLWKSVLSDQWLGPALTLAVILASSDAGDARRTDRICRALLERADAVDPPAENGSARPALLTRGRRSPVWHRNGSNGTGASDDSMDSSTKPYERLALIATAAEIAAHGERFRSPKTSTLIVKRVEEVSQTGGEVSAAKQRLVRTIAELETKQAYGALWRYSTTDQDYSVRREAVRTLAGAGPRAVDATMPKILDALDSAEAVALAPAGRERDEMFSNLKATAWILPSLRTAVADDRRRDAVLEACQKRLLALTPKWPTLQADLEASIASGLKLDAWRAEQRPVDPVATGMLERGQARFWFSRILLLQAVTIRSVAGGAQQIPEAIRRAMRDEHPFVREAARLCKRAFHKGDAGKYIWEDLTQVAAGAPRELAPEATRLAGDVVLALNLKEQGDDEQRVRFGEASRLPPCLSTSKDRREILGSSAPAPDCLFAKDGDCLCPYVYECSPGSSARRELSQALCRHQRLTAQTLRWQESIPKRTLKAFWLRMENLARY